MTLEQNTYKKPVVPVMVGLKSIDVQKLHPDAKIPEYAHGPDEDAGMDLCAIEDVRLEPLTPTLVKTGIAIALPFNYEGQVRPRSGLALKKGITVWNAPGTIDPGYRGEVGVILLSLYDQVIRKGDKIAQLVVSEYIPCHMNVVNELPTSFRDKDGFGSTG